MHSGFRTLTELLIVAVMLLNDSGFILKKDQANVNINERVMCYIWIIRLQK